MPPEEIEQVELNPPEPAAPSNEAPEVSQFPNPLERDDQQVADEADAYEEAFLKEREAGGSARKAQAAGNKAKEAFRAKQKAAEAGDDEDDEEELDDDEAEEEAEDDQAEPEEEKEEEPDPKESKLYTKALNALKRGLPKQLQATIEKMSREEVLEMGLEMAEQQADYDRAINKSRQQTDDTADSEDGTDSGETDEGQAPPDVDYRKTLETLDVDIFGEELPESLGKFGDAITANASKLMTDMVGAMEARLLDGFREHVIDQARSQEMGRNPLLKDPKSWAKIRTAMDELEPSIKFEEGQMMAGRMAKLLNRACHAEFGEEMAKLEAKKVSRKTTRAKRSRGQPEAETPSREEVAKMTHAEREDLYLEVREATGSSREARRAAGFN